MNGGMLTGKTIASLALLVPALLICSCGGKSSSTTASPPSSATPTLSLLAGVIGGTGNQDGTRFSARFNGPSGVAVDSSGNLYVADARNYTIRKITPQGVVTTLAGKAGQPGSDDGVGANARFGWPGSVAIDPSGNIIVADPPNHTIRKISPGGTVTTIAGTAGLDGSNDGNGAAARFFGPEGVAVDGSGNVYVADSANQTIRKITPAGDVTTLAGSPELAGSDDGSGSAARFNYPCAVAVDAIGNVYVVESNNSIVRKITPEGVVTTLAGMAETIGSSDGTGSDARFNFLQGIAVGSDGSVFVADAGNLTIRKISPIGFVTTVAGTTNQDGSSDGSGADARFGCPIGLATDPAGNVYIADSGNNTIRKLSPENIVTTIAGRPRSYGSTDGAGSRARFNQPAGLSVDNSGNIFIADSANRIIRKISPLGKVTTLAGLADVDGSTDGTGSDARFSIPLDITIDRSGNIYVIDYNSTLRKINPSGYVSTLAGVAWEIGTNDGHGTTARFDNPRGIATDISGNVYVTETYKYTIRKITPAGDVTTIAGTVGMPGSADGPSAAAQFNEPTGIAVDSSGNVYVADTGNNTIRRITPIGEVSTLAGIAGTSGSVDGMGAVARFNRPKDIAIDAFDNLYVADSENCTIRKITPGGQVTTIVGIAGSSATILGPLPSSLGYPMAVAVDQSTGDLYISLADAILKVDL